MIIKSCWISIVTGNKKRRKVSEESEDQSLFEGILPDLSPVKPAVKDGGTEDISPPKISPRPETPQNYTVPKTDDKKQMDQSTSAQQANCFFFSVRFGKLFRMLSHVVSQ